MSQLFKNLLIINLIIMSYMLITIPLYASNQSIELTVMLIDNNYDIKPLSNYRFNIHKTNKKGIFIEDKVDPDPIALIETGPDGSANFCLPPGRYAIRSLTAYEIGENMYEWDYMFTVTPDKNISLELSNSNALKHTLWTSYQKQRPLVQTESFKPLKNGVVRVESDTGSGTGIIVDPEGLVVTTAHVLQESINNRVLFNNNKKVLAHLVAIDPKNDLAILRINTEILPEANYIEISRQINTLKKGDKVVAITFPPDSNKSIQSGLITDNTNEIISTNIKPDYNNSGCPLLNSAGELIGINNYMEFFKNREMPISEVINAEKIARLVKIAKKNINDYNISLPEETVIFTMAGKYYPENSLNKDFKLKEYTLDADPYRIYVFSPPVYYSLQSKGEIKEKTIKKSKVLPRKHKANPRKDIINKALNPDSTFLNLSDWATNPKKFKPYLAIEVVPKVQHQDGSREISFFYTGIPIIFNTKQFKFKQDFYDVELKVNGTKIAPIKRSKEWNLLLYSEHFKNLKKKTHSALLFFDPSILGSLVPYHPNELTITIYKTHKKYEPIEITLPAKTIDNLLMDFQPYFQSYQKGN